LQFYKNEELVVNKDQNIKKIIVILQGNLEHMKDSGKEVAATRGELFGENYIKKNREK
jgi:signal-transduction protein with cAMP-binding, CBS, and nucleotidyltransferase domain